MPSKVLVSGIVLIVMICILVFIVEFFLPLSVKADMNTLCRNTLLKMEVEGGLSQDEKLHLQSELEKRGLTEVSISGTAYARQGGSLRLDVDAALRYSRLTALFIRSDSVHRMGYDRVSMSRRVVN
jgi:hypothetical protein